MFTLCFLEFTCCLLDR